MFDYGHVVFARLDYEARIRKVEQLLEAQRQLGPQPGYLCTFSSPTGIRTPVAALKGLSPSPLDDGAMHVKQGTFYL